MQFDLDLIRDEIFTRWKEIAADYSLDGDYQDPQVFVKDVVKAMGQWVATEPIEQSLDNAAVFEAAVKAIWSSGVSWNLVLRRIDAVKNLLHGYDVVAVRRDPKVTASVLATALGTRFRTKQAGQIIQWADWLAETPNFYLDVIVHQAEALHDASSRGQLPNDELMLALAALFSQGRTRSTPGTETPAYRFKLNMPGMGIPIGCEFLRNLHWPGFKPDVHITRLFDHWSKQHGHLVEQYRQQAIELTHIIGRRGPAHMVGPLQYGLMGRDLTPTGTQLSEADNLIWLLGAYIGRFRVFRGSGLGVMCAWRQDMGCARHRVVPPSAGFGSSVGGGTGGAVGRGRSGGRVGCPSGPDPVRLSGLRAQAVGL